MEGAMSIDISVIGNITSVCIDGELCGTITEKDKVFHYQNRIGYTGQATSKNEALLHLGIKVGKGVKTHARRERR